MGRIKTVDIKFSTQDAFLKYHSSGTIKAENWKTKYFKNLWEQ